MCIQQASTLLTHCIVKILAGRQAGLSVSNNCTTRDSEALMKALLKKLKYFSDTLRKQSVIRRIITHHDSHMKSYLNFWPFCPSLHPKSSHFFFSFLSFLLLLHKLCFWPFEQIYKIYSWPTFLLLLLQLSSRNLAKPKGLVARQRSPLMSYISEGTFTSLTLPLFQLLCHSDREQALKGRSLISFKEQNSWTKLLNLTKIAAHEGL